MALNRATTSKARLDVMADSAEERTMKFDSLNYLNIEAQAGTSVRRGTTPASNEGSPTVDDKHATARNWAWAHQSESYDWMDAHSPVSPEDLAG
jgi:hypothetical protein